MRSGTDPIHPRSYPLVVDATAHEAKKCGAAMAEGAGRGGLRGYDGGRERADQQPCWADADARGPIGFPV